MNHDRLRPPWCEFRKVSYMVRSHHVSSLGIEGVFVTHHNFGVVVVGWHFGGQRDHLGSEFEA